MLQLCIGSSHDRGQLSLIRFIDVIGEASVKGDFVVLHELFFVFQLLHHQHLLVPPSGGVNFVIGLEPLEVHLLQLWHFVFRLVVFNVCKRRLERGVD